MIVIGHSVAQDSFVNAKLQVWFWLGFCCCCFVDWLFVWVFVVGAVFCFVFRREVGGGQDEYPSVFRYCEMS